MKYKNDVSFLIDKTLSLYEHQSSYNPNMLLRGFFVLRGSVPETDSPFRAAVQQASVENPTPPTTLYFTMEVKRTWRKNEGLCGYQRCL